MVTAPSFVSIAPEKELLGLSADNGIGQVVFSPLAQGVLTGKYAPGEPPPPGSRAASDEMGGFIGSFTTDDGADDRAAAGPDRR